MTARSGIGALACILLVAGCTPAVPPVSTEGRPKPPVTCRLAEPFPGFDPDTGPRPWTYVLPCDTGLRYEVLSPAVGLWGCPDAAAGSLVRLTPAGPGLTYWLCEVGS